jgi:P-type E1-E2 ATPase
VDGVILMQVTKLPNENMLQQIVNLVESAQLSKPRLQRTADKIASYFVPTIIVLAVICFIVWFALASTKTVSTDGLHSATFSVLFCVAVLVVSCPCAISLAVPTAIMVGTGVAAKHGILFKVRRNCSFSLQTEFSFSLFPLFRKVK